MKLTRFAIPLAAALLALAPTLPAQGNYGFLRDSPLTKFNGEDYKLLRNAAASVLELGAPGASRKWKNEMTGNSGSVELLQVFKSADRRDCRQLRINNFAKALAGTTTLSVCLHSTRGWLLDGDAHPPG